MTALDDAFTRAKKEGRKALLPFLMSGHPTPEDFARNLEEAGKFADVIEVGVPFSDPLADGPVIQAAAVTALKNETTLASTLEVVRNRGLSHRDCPRSRNADEPSKTGTVPATQCVAQARIRSANSNRGDSPLPPVILMLSFNQVLAGGIDNFAARLKEAGVSGAIIPDLPFGENDDVRDIFTSQDLVQISMLAPTSSHDRRQQILEQAKGFVYLISVAGVTGTREGYPPESIRYINLATERAEVPTCVGFGISKPEHIEQLRDHTDGFIVGSALIRGLEEGNSVADILKPLRKACDAQPRPEGRGNHQEGTD